MRSHARMIAPYYPPMQKWEYALLIADPRLISIQLPDKTYSEEPGTLSRALNKLGAAGWELASTNTNSSGDEFMLVLKRPVL